MSTWHDNESLREHLGELAQKEAREDGALDALLVLAMKGVPMFHLKDNIYFGRVPGGCDVRVLKLAVTPKDFPRADGSYPDTLFDVTIDADSWASVVASVSAYGEENGRFYMAKAFHKGG